MNGALSVKAAAKLRLCGYALPCALLFDAIVSQAWTWLHTGCMTIAFAMCCLADAIKAYWEESSRSD
jgi:hypothetical protein